MSVYSDRFVHKAPGLRGGQDGSNAYITVTRVDNFVERLGPKGSATLNVGDVLEVGAGYGVAQNRHWNAVAADIAPGKISRREAEDLYGSQAKAAE